jgi:hypothetical protein
MRHDLLSDKTLRTSIWQDAKDYLLLRKFKKEEYYYAFKFRNSIKDFEVDEFLKSNYYKNGKFYNKRNANRYNTYIHRKERAIKARSKKIKSPLRGIETLSLSCIKRISENQCNFLIDDSTGTIRVYPWLHTRTISIKEFEDRYPRTPEKGQTRSYEAQEAATFRLPRRKRFIRKMVQLKWAYREIASLNDALRHYPSLERLGIYYKYSVMYDTIKNILESNIDYAERRFLSELKSLEARERYQSLRLPCGCLKANEGYCSHW